MSTMKALFIILLTVLAGSAYAETMPIRGATGGGYGRFSWGASLETVETLVRKLTQVESAEERIERRAVRLINKANRRLRKSKTSLKTAPPRLSTYRYWTRLSRLATRVDLSFDRQRLYQAIVGATYSKDDLNIIDDILDVLVEKYGFPQGTPERAANIEVDNELNFTMPGGLLIVQRTPPTSSKTGYIRLLYRSLELYPSVQKHLSSLKDQSAKAQGILSRKKSTNSQKTPREREIEKLRTQL